MQQFSIGGGGRDAGGGWGPLNYEKAELLSHGYALRLWASILGVFNHAFTQSINAQIHTSLSPAITIVIIAIN